MIDTAVILAGGFGTRLAAVVADVPKPMAPVAGRPFLERLLDRLQAQGLRRVVLAVGYRHEIIRGHFGARYRELAIEYSLEQEPLGTGGALRQAFAETGLARAFALNGDTYCDLGLAALEATHVRAPAEVTLALVRVADAARFGAVELDGHGRVRAFREKSAQPAPGLINAGVYMIERSALERAPAAARFSFEQDVLQPQAGQGSLGGHVVEDALFIDIGVPDDFRRAQQLLAGL